MKSLFTHSIQNELQNNKQKWIVIVMTVLILIAVNVTIYKREQTIQHGKIILLELAPVDPRSLMQGDYMALQYQIANQAFRIDNMNADTEHNKNFPQDGYIIAELDDKAIAQFKRFETEEEKLANKELKSHEIKLRYRMRNGVPKFATNAFFFEEGTAEIYEKARYGEFRVADNGDIMLTNMRDQDLRELTYQTKPLHIKEVQQEEQQEE